MLRCCYSVFFLLCLTNSVFSGNHLPVALKEQYVLKYQALERFNDENEKAGRKDLNDYLIVLDTSNWIEEKPIRYYLHESYTRLRDALVEFNRSRTDSLRFYVVVVNNYYAKVKENVNIDSLPAHMNRLADFVQYDTDADDKFDYKFFKEESQKIFSEIADGLKKNNYVNRIIYSFSIIQFYDYEYNFGTTSPTTNVNLVLSDNLFIDGPKLSKKQYAIRYRAKVNFNPDSRKEPINNKIEKAVFNIMNAVRMVIDEDLDGPPPNLAASCAIELNEAVVKTKRSRDTLYNASVESVAKFFDNPLPAQRYKSNFLIVDDIKVFPTSEVLLTHALPDKLNLMASGHSDFKMYVVLKEISFAMMAYDWSAFAKKVYEKSTSAKQISNLLLVVIPYYKGSCTYTNMLGGQVGRSGLLVFPGAYCSGNAGLMAQMNAAFAAGATLNATTTASPFTMAFNEAFKRVPKNYKAFLWRILWNGDAIYEGVQTYKKVTGYSDIVSMRIYQDQRLANYKTEMDGLHCAPYENMECEYMQQQAIDRVLAIPSDFVVAEGSSDLIQSGMNEEVTKKFVENVISFAFGLKVQMIDDDLFYGGKNPFKIKSRSMVLNLIDVASIAASFVGFDFVFDAIGAVYAFSIGENEEGALYLTALAIPIATGGQLRIAVIEGKNIVLKGAKGAYSSLSKKMYGLTFRQRTAKDFSHILEATLNPEVLTKVKPHGSNIEFLDDIETTILSEPKAVATINAQPEIIDDLVEMQARKSKSTLNDLLTHRENVIKLGLDPDVVKSFERIKDSPGWFTVIVHGDGSGKFLYQVADGKWVKIDHRALATYMKKNGYQRGTPVMLVACEGGAANHTLAQDLANKLGATVRSPDVKVGVDKLGNVVSRDPGGKAGKWIEYTKGNYTATFNNAIPQPNIAGEVTTLGDIAIPTNKLLEDAKTLFHTNPNDSYKQIMQGLVDGHTPAKFEELITLEEEAVFRYFAAEGNHTLNDALIKGTTNELLNAQKAIVNHVIQTVPKHPGTIIYRGAGSAESAERALLQVGDEINFKQFIFASKDEAKAKQYLTLGGDNGFVMYEITHKNAVDLSGLSVTSAHWEELIFSTGSRFKVTKKVDKVTDGKMTTTYSIVEL